MAEASPEKQYDLYASILNYKKKVTSLKLARSTAWVPYDHLRRIQAYEILTAFYQNYSRDMRFAPETGDTSHNDAILESGDPAWLCNKIKSKILGANPRITMPGPKFLKEIKSLKAAAAAGDKTQDARLQEFTALADIIQKRLSYLQDWYDENDVCVEIDENETTCSYLGDMVYLVEWLADEQRPNLLTYDPGYYLPDDNIENGESLESGKSGVVERAFVAWEEWPTDPITGTALGWCKVWRDTYELRITGEAKACWRHSAYYKFADGVTQQLATFRDEDIIEGSGSGWVSLGIDFIPIVQIPNIKIQGQVFGVSNLHWLIGLFDAIINACNDLKHNSEYLGGATVFASGKEIKYKRDATTGEPSGVKIQPNTLYILGEGGRMDLLDTSAMQKALLDTMEAFDKRMIRDSEITEIGAGVYSSQQELSGKALKILIQPLMDKITPMRAIRRRRYSMIFWMIQRLWQIFGTPEEKPLFDGDLYNAYMEFGALLPDDESEALDKYIKMEGLIGLEATLDKMVEEGWDINPATILAKKKEQQAAQMQAQMDAFGLRRAEDTGGTDDGAGAAGRGEPQQ